VPVRELRLLGVPSHRYFGEKAIFALIGLGFPAIATALLAVFGIHLPFTVPVLASLALAAILWFLPDYNARDNAAKARQEFVRALGAYIDLVALERHAGAGATQALEGAAAIGDSWVVERIREELARARWSGHPPWDGLADLAEDLQLPELADLADIMRLSGEEGATVYTSLRARSASMRAAILSHEHALANAADERLTFPVTVLAFIFLLLVSTPAILRILLGGSA
jgi:Flp pilus assembly protein TadB